jgi:acetylornithine/succinyldiaminopimelate/putrescine aminotransferase
MLGFELADKNTIPAFARSDKPAALQLVDRLHKAGLLTIPSGAQVVRLLPALNLTQAQAVEGIAIISEVLAALAA